MAPPVTERRMMLRNCSGVCSRDWAVTVAFSSWPGTEGAAPICPAETWAFWAWIAAITSEVASL